MGCDGGCYGGCCTSSILGGVWDLGLRWLIGWWLLPCLWLITHWLLIWYERLLKHMLLTHMSEWLVLRVVVPICCIIHGLALTFGSLLLHSLFSFQSFWAPSGPVIRTFTMKRTKILVGLIIRSSSTSASVFSSCVSAPAP